MADPNEDSDSSWGDSTLDFTSPRQLEKDMGPKIKIEIEDEDVSRADSVVDKPKPKERSTIPANQPVIPDDDLETDVPTPIKKDAKATYQLFSADSKPRQGRPSEESPPYNFRPALAGDLTPQRDNQRPGKERKGTTYDTPEKGSRPRSGSLRSTHSWDDSEEEQKTLQELRRNFSMEKLKEQQAEELRLKLKNQELEERHDDGQATNRSETTWKSWASFGTKLGRSSNRSNKSKNARKKEGVPVATRTDDVPVQASTIVSRQQQQQRPNPTSIFQAEPSIPPDNGLPGYPSNRELDTIPVDKQRAGISHEPAMMSAPYIVKDEEGGITYYFGHGPLQYYEVDDDDDSAMLPRLADRLEVLFQRVWQEVFGALRILTSFFIMMVVELLKYVFKSIFQPIVIGVFQSLGEYVIKPLLSVIFNGSIQPLSIFLWNCFTTFKHMFGPIGDILKLVFVQLAMLCRSIRLVEINWKTNQISPPIDYNTDGAKNV